MEVSLDVRGTDVVNTAYRSAVIILHYGDRQITGSCIDSLLPHDPFPLIILVDNDPLNRFDPAGIKGIVHLVCKENLGFSAGVNLGIRVAMEMGMDAVLLLNNDVVASPGTVLRLIDLSISRCCLAGGVEKAMVPGKNRIPETIFAGGSIVFREVAVRLWRSPPCRDRVYETGFVRGAAMAFPLDMVRHIGFMDEAYWSYLEDVDYCIRARRAGYRLLIDPGAVLRHRVSAAFTPCLRNFLMARNYIRLLTRHAEGIDFISGMVLGLAAALASVFRRERRGKLSGYLAGVMDATPFGNKFKV